MGKAPETAKFWEDSWLMKDINITQQTQKQNVLIFLLRIPEVPR
jgi:hypothetical protein